MDVSGKKVTLIGMGRTSMALARLLKKLGAQPFVTECKLRSDCSSFVAALEAEQIPFECGLHTNEAIQGSSLIIPSPGVPPNIPLLRDAIQSGLPMMSELEFVAGHCTSTLIAVTGTNGKTTTTELIAHLIRSCGKDVALAGNNNNPFSTIPLMDAQPDYVVLEISSYQLELVDQFRPHIAAVLNVTNDHLARHGTIKNYADTKARIFARQDESDFAILNDDDPLVSGMSQKLQSQVLRFGTSDETDIHLSNHELIVQGKSIAARADSPLPGQHNTKNILAALAVITPLDLDPALIREGLRTFTGVEHRIEAVTNYGGVEYFNDSKSTNLDSLKVALESFDDNIVLIAGGEGKGGDYTELSGLIRTRVKLVVAIGADAELIRQAWGSCTMTILAEDMMSAVQKARDAAKEGDIILLSPACASFDMYANFEDRGRDLKRCVRDLTAAGGST